MSAVSSNSPTGTWVRSRGAFTGRAADFSRHGEGGTLTAEAPESAEKQNLCALCAFAVLRQPVWVAAAPRWVHPWSKLIGVTRGNVASVSPWVQALRISERSC